MKILIACDCYKPTINGVVTSVVNLKTGLEALGHEVKVVTLSNNFYSYIEGDVYYFGSLDLGVLYPGVRFTISGIQKEIWDILYWKPDIIHTQSEFSTFFIAKRIARKLSIPIVHTYHTLYTDYTHYFSMSKTVGIKAVEKYISYIGDSISCMVAPTEKIHQTLIEYGVTCPISVIPTGITLDKFYKKEEQSCIDELKKSLNLPKDALILLSVSRIAKEKNIDEIIKYVGNLKDEKIFFLIVGDGPAKEDLVELTNDLELNHKVLFTGMVAPEKVPMYYQLADLFVSASTSETQGLTYIEALASSTPILCKKDECLDEVLIEYKNGYSFDSEEEFHEKLDIFISKTDKTAMTKIAEKSVEKFSKEDFVKTMAELYKTQINAKYRLE